jgi:hypothetical protein
MPLVRLVIAAPGIPSGNITEFAGGEVILSSCYYNYWFRKFERHSQQSHMLAAAEYN